MTNLFLSTVQAAVLFEKIGFFGGSSKLNLEDLASKYCEIQQSKAAHRYNVVEHSQGKFFRLYGGTNLMITLELINRPANSAVFSGALDSPFTKMTAPQASNLISKQSSHLLINVRHGVLPDIPSLYQLLKMNGEGHSIEEFKQRLEVCELLVRLAHDLGNASLIHWTQSNMILPPKMFEGPFEPSFPQPLHIHPWLYQNGKCQDGRLNVGINTFGAQHFIGREISVLPSPIPWADSYQVALAFLKVATMENGYVIPDGDNFGIEGNDFSYRVNHIPAKNSGEAQTPAKYELELRYSKSHKYQSPDHTTDGDTVELCDPPIDLPAAATLDMDNDATNWDQKRQMAEKAGLKFQVTAPPSSTRPVFGKRH